MLTRTLMLTLLVALPATADDLFEGKFKATATCTNGFYAKPKGTFTIRVAEPEDTARVELRNNLDQTIVLDLERVDIFVAPTPKVGRISQVFAGLNEFGFFTAVIDGVKGKYRGTFTDFGFIDPICNQFGTLKVKEVMP